MTLRGMMQVDELREVLYEARRVIDLQCECGLLNRPDPKVQAKKVQHSEEVQTSYPIDQRVVEWANEMRIVLDKKVYYWMLPQGPGMRWGYFMGLPNKRGSWKITNGIDLWIELHDGTPFKGHLDWFVKEQVKTNRGKGFKSKAKDLIKELSESKNNNKDKSRAKLLALLED